MNDRTVRLLALMEQHKLTSRQVGELIGRTAHTVRCWRCKWADRAIPEHTLAVLEMKLAGRA